MATLEDIRKHFMPNQSMQTIEKNPPFRRIDSSITSGSGIDVPTDINDFEEGIVSGFAVQQPVLQKPSGFVPANHQLNDNYDTTFENVPQQQVIAGNKAGDIIIFIILLKSPNLHQSIFFYF